MRQKKAVINEVLSLASPTLSNALTGAGPAWQDVVDHARLMAKSFTGYEGTKPKTWGPAAKALLGSAQASMPKLPAIQSIVGAARAGQPKLPHPMTLLRTH